MINQKVRRAWDRLMRPVGRSIGGIGVSPNAVTGIGIAVQGLVAWLIVDGRLLAAGLVAIVAGLLDTVDGAVAKARGMTSKFGAFLDSTTDRLADSLFFLPIAWLYGVSPDIEAHDRPWVAAVAMVALVASFLVSYVKARGEALGFEVKTGLVERAERIGLMVVALVFSALLPAILVLLTVASVVTIGQRVVEVRRQAGAE